MLRSDSEPRSALFVGQQTGIGRGLVRRLINRLGQLCSGWRIELRQIFQEDPSTGVRPGQTDIGLVWLPVVVADDMEHVVVAEEPIVLAVPEGHKLTGRPSLGFAEIVTLSLIALPEQAGDPRDFWLVGHARYEPAPVASATHTPDEALGAVTAGLGVVPPSLGNSVVHTHPGVVFIPVPDLPFACLTLVRRTGDNREVTIEALRAV